jgi:hypothetical protein
MPGSPNADRAEFVEVRFIFVKSKEAAEGEWFGDASWYVIVQNEAEDFGKGLEMGL